MKVIGRLFNRFDVIPSSMKARLMFNFHETMLTAHLSRSKVTAALDQRVLWMKRKELHHFTQGAVFNRLGHGPPPLIVVPTFSGAVELFIGRDAFVPESHSGWCTGRVFVAFAEHFCGWLTRHRARIGAASSAKAVLIVDNAQLHADPGALSIFRANQVRVISLLPHCTHLQQPVGVAWAKPFQHGFSTLVRSRRTETWLAFSTCSTAEL
jgi:hypothetical protein